MDATENHKITWGKTNRENEYKTTLGKNAVSIRCHTKYGEDEKKAIFYAMLLWNKEGENIDEYHGGITYTRYSLDSLFEAARRSTLKVEDTLDMILSELDTKK